MTRNIAWETAVADSDAGSRCDFCLRCRNFMTALNTGAAMI